MLNSQFFHSRFAVIFLAASISFVSAVCHASKRDREEDLSPDTDWQVKVFKTPLPIKPESQPETAYFYMPGNLVLKDWQDGKYVEMRIDQAFGTQIDEKPIDQITTQNHQNASRAELDAAIKLMSRKLPINRAKGLNRLTLLADSGDIDAQFLLGQTYDSGELIERDAALARKYYLKASMAGNMDADHALGLLAKNGGLSLLRMTGSFDINVRKFFFEAFHAFLRGFLRGNYSCAAELGYLYSSGYIRAGVNYPDSVFDENVKYNLSVPKPRTIDQMIASDYYMKTLDMNPEAFHITTQAHPEFLSYLKSLYPIMDAQNSEKFENYCLTHNIELSLKPKPDPSIMQRLIKRAEELKADRIRQIDVYFDKLWNSK